MPKVKVGVAWRRDGRGQAHLGDLGVFGHPSLANQVEVYSLDWEGAETGGGLRKALLSNMDLLVIPGGPHANSTQIPVKGQAVQNVAVNKASDKAKDYADARARSELDLIEQARTLGMPILALCGGSWRLVQNYGGSTVELAAIGADGKFLAQGENQPARSRHAGNMQHVATEFKHALGVTTDSLLEDAMSGSKNVTPLKNALPHKDSPRWNAEKTLTASKGQRVSPPTNMQVNSVHWAVVRTSSMGTRDGLQPQPFEVVPNNMLRMSARDPTALGTLEAVESAHGAPVLGVQWHPEYQLPMKDGQQAQSRAANLALLQWMIKAGSAYRAHRDTMAALLGSTKLRTAAEVQFRGAPAHTGDPGVGPGARSIPKHKDDTDPAAFARAELALRSYLFNLGRKGKLFLTPTELFNAASGAPLSRVRDQDELHKDPVVAFMKRNVWAQKYCSDVSKKVILAWPK